MLGFGVAHADGAFRLVPLGGEGRSGNRGVRDGDLVVGDEGRGVQCERTETTQLGGELRELGEGIVELSVVKPISYESEAWSSSSTHAQLEMSDLSMRSAVLLLARSRRQELARV